MFALSDLGRITGLQVCAQSLADAGPATCFMARRGVDKLVGCVGRPCLPDAKKAGEIEGKCVCVGPLSAANAAAVRKALPWTAPSLLGLSPSFGFGDRLGLATPGHIRAIRGEGEGFPLKPIFAQQSIREMTRTGRTPQQVMDDATWGVLQEGWQGGFGSDADHVQRPEDLEACVAAGFTMFTIDPGLHVVNQADTMAAPALESAYAKLDFDTLSAKPADLCRLYAGRTVSLCDGGSLWMDDAAFLRAAVKYGGAIAHTIRMYRRLRELAGRPFELEVSVDETDSPTSPAEHYLFASELRRAGVQWVSMAPRFIGRFEKGVDYIGDLAAFRASLAEHVAVSRTVGPYKLSLHSGSDKFSIYPVFAEETGGLLHVKTAGTSYLEALRAVATIDPKLFREVLDFARLRYQEDRRTYHVSADLAKVPASAGLGDGELAGLLEQFDAREVLHVTFGSVLTAEGGRRFRDRVYAALESNESIYIAALREHFGKHLRALGR